MHIYLDNAATTRIDPEVLQSMLPYMTDLCGNPSSLHRYGCRAKVALENARKKIAHLVHAAPAEIVFTSGGTEGNNMLLQGIIAAMHIRHVLTSPLEHMAVRMPLECLAKQGIVQLTYAPINQRGELCLDYVKMWLKNNRNALVSFMRVNHEIGNITDVCAIGQLCQTYGAFFHSDTVQSLYCLEHDFSQLPIHLALGSAHKIHGPKGVGFAYIHPKASVAPLLHGGSQELNRRGGTENVPSIMGMATALEIAVRDRAQTATHLQSIKKYMIEALQQQIPMVRFNGTSAHETQSSPTVLNVSFPHCPDRDMLVYNLDIHGIAASTGSACTSGSNTGSQVVSALQTGESHAIRFSFSKYTTQAEIEQTAAQLATLCNEKSGGSMRSE